MDRSQRLLRNISDTALWAAMYRAREFERPDALFRDHLARRLAGARGETIAAKMPSGTRDTWAWIARTVLFDRFIAERVAQGADMVVNLAAGLDARPYRMALPRQLQWVEVDLPDLLDYKASVLSAETPSCRLQRIGLDLTEADARRELFARLGHQAQSTVVVTEGLIIYLSPEEVGRFARDLHATDNFNYWILDLVSPGLLRMIQKHTRGVLDQAEAPLKFAPREGPPFFIPYGWRPESVQSLLKTAAGLNRVPWWMKLLSYLPESSGTQGRRPWAAVCSCVKTDTKVPRGER